MPRKPPNFRNSREFLADRESSDEEMDEADDVVIEEHSRNVGQGISKTHDIPMRKSAKLRASLSTKPAPKYVNLEA